MAMFQCLLFSQQWCNSTSQICFENQKRNDIGNDCLLSVDGTDCSIKGYKLKNGNPDPDYYSYKLKKAGLRYKVVLCIRTTDIV